MPPPLVSAQVQPGELACTQTFSLMVVVLYGYVAKNFWSMIGCPLMSRALM